MYIEATERQRKVQGYPGTYRNPFRNAIYGEHLIIMDFQVIGAIRNVQIIAVRKNIRIVKRLEKYYGKGRWRKMKGIATVQLADDTQCLAEVHWYESHGIGKIEMKIKHFLT